METATTSPTDSGSDIAGTWDGAGAIIPASMSSNGFVDDFSDRELEVRNWFPFHLPHWSSQERSRARYRMTGHSLILSITDDQPSWCPEFDGAVRVSALQSGCFSGPLDSHVGQHRFNDRVRVREEQRTRRLQLVHHGRVELRCRARLTSTALVSLYLIGFEDTPEASGEITVMEVFGHGVTPAGIRLGRGVKAINDPRLTDEFTDELIEIDIADWHTYRIDWTPDGIDFFCDGTRISTTEQSPDYPMQLMLTLYELPGDGGVITSPLRAEFEIDLVRHGPLPPSGT